MKLHNESYNFEKKISRGSQEKKSSKEVENKMKHKAAVGRVFPKIITG